jgi:mono/diheme cytochrome c family protein
MTWSCVATRAKRAVAMTSAAALAALASCGGGSTGTDAASGVNKTYLSVDATDADGDALQYQWRVTGGTIDNRNDSQTVWTMPDGPGLHFAYVSISDGKGGWVEQQYAVSSDTLGTTAATPAPITRVAPATVEIAGSQNRLRFSSADATQFQPPDASAPQLRTIFLPDVTVSVVSNSTGNAVFAGLTDVGGDLDLPQLATGSYTVLCATQPDVPLNTCGNFFVRTDATIEPIALVLPPSQNLRLFGHIALADGGVCGYEDAYFSIQSAATVQLQQADGTALGRPVRVNRFGDYAIDAAVPALGALNLQLVCEAYAVTLAVPASSNPAGYISDTPVELSYTIPNSRPVVVKMVANGGDGNVRGRMIVPGQGTGSNTDPGPAHFLTYKGRDTKLSACLYYRALGAVADCDAQGNMISPISLDDWMSKNGFGTAADVAATYINRRDLNLVRRMTATSSANGVAFVVCNAPGPDGQSQQEIDDDINVALGDLQRVACVAMEYSVIAGANGGQPLTQFYTFGPTGDLLASINLDGRGEKFMPGSCVACHGGSTYNGRFPELATASPNLGSRFLPFDTGNYLFSSNATLSESAQSESFYQLNQLVAQTELSASSPASTLIAGWYANGHVLDKTYVPPAWQNAEASKPGASMFYTAVVGASCRTCHVALGPNFDWDSTVLSPGRVQPQFCGGTPDIARNATMPNALITSDALVARVNGDAQLAALVTQFLGCTAAAPDPIYPKR